MSKAEHAAKELKFLATPEKGEVSALLIRPEEATHLLVLGHGASTNMRHDTLQTIADRPFGKTLLVLAALSFAVGALGLALLAGSDSFNALTPQQIAARFGIAFADAITHLPLNQWTDGVPGAHGRYRVRVIARDIETAPPIEQIRNQLTGDLLEQRQQRYLQAALAGLRPLYGLAR